MILKKVFLMVLSRKETQMKLTLINNTGYKDIRVEFDSREHFLKGGENVFENAPNDLQLKVKIYDKSKVYFWSMLLLNVFLFDYMLGDEIGSADVVCTSEYTISATGDECVIELSKISAFAKNGISFSSVFLNTQHQIQRVVHSINSLEQTRKEFVMKNSWVLALVTGIIALICLLNAVVGLAVGLFSLFFTIPCFVRIVKSKKLFSNEQASLFLNEQIAREIENRKNPPKNIIDAVSKGFFKKKKK